MTSNTSPLQQPEYLIVGHMTIDLTPNGPILGGTAAYAGLTASALGLDTYVVTAAGPGMNLKPLSALTVSAIPSEVSTVFENIYDSGQRRQRVLSQAQHIASDSIPRDWRTPGIVHLAPVAQEVDPLTIDGLSYSFLGITPQGWMRDWDEEGNVGFLPWNDEASLLQSAEAIVLSMEDIGGDENLIADMAKLGRVLVLTDGPRGARVYWRGQRREFEAPNVEELDSTGSGDIFAACFFVRLQQTRDPWEAARFANFLAAASVTRSGLESVPKNEEIKVARKNSNL